LRPPTGNPSRPDDTPVVVGPVVAWRSWFIQKEDGGWMLDSVIHRCLWQPREPLAAHCLTTRGEKLRKHFAPADRCMCGVYGASTLGRLANYITQGLGPQPRIQAVGTVKLWGDVLTHEQGWRASHGYPDRLWLPRETVRREPVERWEEIAFDLAGYGVPVEIMDSGHPGDIVDELDAWAGTNPGAVTPSDVRET
jgi:hypothetical protein